MAIQKLFELGNSNLSSKAETKPPKGMPVEEIKCHIATLQYRCLICNSIVNKTYHIHHTIYRKTGNKYANTG